MKSLLGSVPNPVLLHHLRLRFYSINSSVSSDAKQTVLYPRFANESPQVVKSTYKHPVHVATLGKLTKTSMTNHRQINISPDLESEIRTSFLQILKINVWFSNRVVTDTKVELISHPEKEIMKIKVYFDTLYTNNRELSKPSQEIETLMKELTTKIFDAGSKFGMTLQRIRNPIIRASTRKEKYIQATMKIKTRANVMSGFEVGNTENQIYNFFDSIKGKDDNLYFWGDRYKFDTLRQENRTVLQELTFSPEFEKKICGLVIQAAKCKCFPSKLWHGSRCNALLTFTENKSSISIHTNIKLNSWLRTGTQMTLMNEFNDVVEEIIDELGLKSFGLNIDLIRGSRIKVTWDKKIALIANINTKFDFNFVVPDRSQNVRAVFDLDILRRKKILDRMLGKKKYKGSKFVNFDKLDNLGAQAYNGQDNGEKSITMTLVEHKSEQYYPVNGLNPVNVTTPAGKNFTSPTNREVIEQIGKSIINELAYTWSVVSFEKTYSSPLILTDNYFKQLKHITLVQSNTTEVVKLNSIESVYSYVGLSYLQSKDTSQITRWYRSVIETEGVNFHFDISLMVSMWSLEFKSLESYDYYGPLDYGIFSSVKRPSLFLTGRLPPIPKLSNQNLYPFVQISLLHLTDEFRDSEINTLKRLLDGLGDTVLKRFSAEYFIELQNQMPNFKWNMDDIHFVNSNLLFNRLAISYKLHDGILNQQHTDIMKGELEGSLDRANELLGDSFERLVAVVYLDDSEKCRKWISEIYTTLIKAFMVDKSGIQFLDKEKYVKMYEYSLKTFRLY
ncbi:hypothetical protein G210_4500 [Candida maltosa Xu316]|uniref:Uncharacterized protein n=1 Tax=Candida maltosa (strain Xu316) TaxID=1245528 RepID=M3JRB7_CANMX|nr:hypothetical protein G210_4500 [Candida maltosa Xu316]